MKRRTSRRGVLLGLRYSTKSKKRPKQSLLRKVAGWAGGSVLIAILVAMVGFMLARMFNPSYGVHSAEGDFEVIEFNEYDEPSPAEADAEAEKADEPGAVAEAIIEIQGTKMRVPLTAEQAETVQLGTRIHATYTIYPQWRLEGVVIQEWWPAGSPPEEAALPAGDEPRTDEPQAN